MLVSHFYAAIQVPDITLAERCEAINDLTRLPWALTLLSHSPDFDILLEMMQTNSRPQYDEFLADGPRLRNLIVAPLLVNSHSFNCLLSTADVPAKMAENRPPSSIRIGTVIHALVLAYFSDDVSAAERALRNPALLPSYLRILVESNPAVNALRSLKAAKNVFPVVEDQENFDYSTFFDLNYLTTPYLETLAKAVGDSKPLSKLQKLMRENSTSVNVDEEIVVIDKISRRDLRYVRLPRFEKLFLKDVYETIIIAATPDVKVVKQAGVGNIREEFLYEIPSSEEEEDGAGEEGVKEKPSRVKPLNEPLPQEEDDSEDEADEAAAWPPPPPPATQSRNRQGGRGQGKAPAKDQASTSSGKKPPVDYTGGRDRQVKERHKNRDKQRGADRKARQTGFL
uniref:CUE domain-containing protein n=1 Tax=Panagrellus redivivus TaxID=6233 RepID=A0A7E4VKF5_PANRE